jgi:phosphoglycerate dehydrogenase-like enzyme
MSASVRPGSVPGQGKFRVGFSADFRRDDGSLAFPDIGLSLLEGVDGVEYDFVREYRPEYLPDQIAGYDVLISLKPRVTAQSLEGASRLCAIGRCGVGYDNVDLKACTERGIAVYITPAGVVRPVAESILLLVLGL